MNIVLFLFIVVLLIVCIVLITMLILKNKNSISTSVSENFEESSPQNLDIKSIQLPKKIEDMDSHTLFQACKKVFDSFKALDYPKRFEHDLDKMEWHTWQVSLLLGILKTDRSFFFPESQKTFHNCILKSSETDIEEQIRKILRKYSQTVNINKSRDELSNDISWTSFEVSFIFYYMLNK